MNNVTKLDNWHEIDWQVVEAKVRNLRQRIFEARRNNQLTTLKNLQKLMLRSRANWLQAIRRVTQINQGRRTPGIDREVVTTPAERLEMFYWLETITLNDWAPPPTQRHYIPKGNGKKRPLGIPTIRDRVIQAIVKNALEPEWEAVFEPTSYGFRPGRSTHDAIADVWSTLNKGVKQWILDADIKGAFDHISHDYLLEKLGYFPAKPLIKKWLKAGVMVGMELTPTEAGTPQGGVISPLLANIALDGLEEAIGYHRVYYQTKTGLRGFSKAPNKLVRYADDFVVMCPSQQEAEKVQLKIQSWLKARGLTLSTQKSRIVQIQEGFDFLGFNIRRHPNNRRKRGWSIYTKPTQARINRFKNKVREIFQRNLHRPPGVLLIELNPLIRGWGMYYRTGTSSQIFSALDHFLWHRCWRYAARRHPRKNKGWRRNKYFTTVQKDRWVFYDDQTTVTIRRLRTIKSIHHIKIKALASPDDPKLTQYWELRQLRPKAMTTQQNYLWSRQKGKCAICQGWLDTEEALNIDHINSNRNDNRLQNLQLLHETCHAQKTHQRKAA
jgi:RNA-directed DNA polymerase